MRVVIDSNRLQSEELRLFLECSASNIAVLTDYAWMEAYKGDSMQSIFKSMSVLKDFPDQVIMLRGTKAVGALDARAPGIGNRMIWPRSKNEFTKTVHGLCQATMGDQATIDQILAHGQAATRHIANVLSDAAGIQSVLFEVSKLFSNDEISIFRSGSHLSQAMREKILLSAKYLSDSLFRAHPNNPRKPSRNSLVNTFIFRYSLASCLYLVDWIKKGSQLNTKPKKVLNDLVDLNFATYGTYFNGLMSDDRQLNERHLELRYLTVALGGRVPEDYLESFCAAIEKFQ